jgi:membrane-bound lytic murein transglycosylase B
MRKGVGVRRALSGRWRKAAAVMPLVVLSGALSANAATNGDNSPVSDTSATRPGAPAVPTTAFDQPASVALPGGAMPGMTAGLAPESSFDFFSGDAPSDYRQSMGVNASNASVSGIPASALQAYQRAAAILNQADPACNIDWSLIAGIGRVESDHGRYGGNALDGQGKARPGIYGIALDGSNGTARILDSDGGQFDNDAVYDRAVGPMQFIPGTWSAAGVDADQDGTKDPQDIDDAATASAVYLCAGSDDLSTDPGKRAAVYRYNHSNEYVNLVLSFAAAYAGGEYTAVPNGTPSSTTLVPTDFQATPDGRPASGTRGRPEGGQRGGDTRGGTASSGSVSGGNGGGSGGGGSTGGGSTGGDDGGSTGGGGGGNDGGDEGGSPVAPAPEEPTPRDPVGDAVDGAGDAVRDTVKKVTPKPKPEPAPAPSPTPDLLSLSEARAACQSQGVPVLKLGACAAAVAGSTAAQAGGIISRFL